MGIFLLAPVFLYPAQYFVDICSRDPPPLHLHVKYDNNTQPEGRTTSKIDKNESHFQGNSLCTCFYRIVLNTVDFTNLLFCLVLSCLDTGQHPGGGGTHLFGWTGMCHSHGSPFYKKSLNMGPIFYQKILKHGSTFLTKPTSANFWKMGLFFKKNP